MDQEEFTELLEQIISELEGVLTVADASDPNVRLGVAKRLQEFADEILQADGEAGQLRKALLRRAYAGVPEFQMEVDEEDEPLSALPDDVDEWSPDDPDQA